MTNKSYSPLGYILESMNIQTITLAKAIHVDSSLVSKWKTGARSLSKKSIYFEDVIDFILQLDHDPQHHFLAETLRNFYPHDDINENTDLAPLLQNVLSNKKTPNTIKSQELFYNEVNSISTLVYESNAGKREAITKMLDYATTMTTPGSFLFIDAEEFSWLLEDAAYSDYFCTHIVQLLNRGFHAKFAIHYSSYKERFVNFFYTCASFIFHKNVEWYYYHYYNETIFNISFFILNRAVSLLSLSSNGLYSTTTIFTDSSTVLQHEALAHHTLKECNLFFSSFDILQFTEVVKGLHQFHKQGTFYTVLSAPAFITVNPDLLYEVLTDNKVSKKNIDCCVESNRKLRALTSHYFKKNAPRNEPFIYIFHLEKMMNRATKPPFISRTLSLQSDKEIVVTPNQYARALRALAYALDEYKNLQIILVSEHDSTPIPPINCWCQENAWMLQMDKEGFRLSEELSIIDSTFITIERCIRSVPPIRRERTSVKQFLLELANNIDLEASRP